MAGASGAKAAIGSSPATGGAAACAWPSLTSSCCLQAQALAGSGDIAPTCRSSAPCCGHGCVTRPAGTASSSLISPHLQEAPGRACALARRQEDPRCLCRVGQQLCQPRVLTGSWNKEPNGHWSETLPPSSPLPVPTAPSLQLALPSPQDTAPSPFSACQPWDCSSVPQMPLP